MPELPGFMRTEMRRDLHRIWRQFATERDRLTADELRMARAMDAHPEWHATFAQADPPQVDRNDVANPYLHVSLHVAVEEQAESGQPLAVAEALARLAAAGVDPHEAQHRVMTAMAEVMWSTVVRGLPFDGAAYEERLRALKP